MQVISRCKGRELVGKTYKPLFPYFQHLKQAPQNGYSATSGPFRVVSDSYVTDSSGTGVVHQSPFFGEDDLRVCLVHGAALNANPALSVMCVECMSMSWFKGLERMHSVSFPQTSSIGLLRRVGIARNFTYAYGLR